MSPRLERDATEVTYGFVASPLGPILAACDDRGLCRLNFTEGTAPLTPTAEWRRDDDALAPVAERLTEYFRGEARAFEDLHLSLRGTEFEIRVWRTLRTIAWGYTWTYGEIAAAIGRPGAARAVGGAVGRNPVPIIVPCHRVVASGGRIGGFTGGLAIKRHLLGVEGVTVS